MKTNHTPSSKKRLHAKPAVIGKSGDQSQVLAGADLALAHRLVPRMESLPGIPGGTDETVTVRCLKNLVFLSGTTAIARLKSPHFQTSLILGKEKEMKTRSVSSNKKVLTYNLSEPLCGATNAKVDIDTASGNLTIDTLTSGEPVLASGSLEYVENQGLPTRTVNTNNGQATLTLKSTSLGRPWFRFPWSACNAATNWQIHLNRNVQAEITAHSGGGNVKLNLAAMTVRRVMADSGGGNLDVVLPDNAANLSVTAKTGGGKVTVEIGRGTTGSNILNATSGAGNVEVRIPSGLAARIYATSGWGKEIVDPRFGNIDKHLYQSSDFDRAADKVEITVQSGAGNVVIKTK